MHETPEILKVLIDDRAWVTKEIERLQARQDHITGVLEAAALPLVKEWFRLKRSTMKRRAMVGPRKWIYETRYKHFGRGYVDEHNLRIINDALQFGYWDDYFGNGDERIFIDLFQLPLSALYDDSWKAPLIEERRARLLEMRQWLREEKQTLEDKERKQLAELLEKYGRA